jgi:hypothetical protein
MVISLQMMAITGQASCCWDRGSGGLIVSRISAVHTLRGQSSRC